MNTIMTKPPRKFANDPSKVFNLLQFKQFLKFNVYEMKINEKIQSILDGMQNLKVNSEALFDSGEFTNLLMAVPSALKDAYTLMVQEDSNGQSVLNASSPIDFDLGIAVDSFFLPAPNKITESYAQKYDETSYNLEEKMARRAVGAVQSAVGLVSQDLANTIPSILGLAQDLMKRGNMTIDPNNLMAYAGSIPRHFNLDFILIPNNKEQAEYYNELINFLKYYSAASRNTSNFYGSLGIKTLSIENCFDMQFLTVKNNELKYNNAMKKLLISDKESNPTGGFYMTSIAITIGDQGISQIYYDGTPKVFNLSISLTERQPMYANNWEKLVGKEFTEWNKE